MRRWIPILAVVLGLQGVLALYLSTRGEQLAPQPTQTALVTADLGAVDRVVIDGPAAADGSAGESAKVELVKRDGRWLMPGYHGAPVDAGRLQGLLDRLTRTPRGFPVARSAEARARFKADDKTYERRLVASVGDKPVATVLLGTSPGLRKSHARTALDDVVYAIELPTQDLPTAPADWLDGAMLQIPAANLNEVQITRADQSSLLLVRQPAAADKPNERVWKSAGGGDAPIDPARANTLAEQIAGLRVDAVLGDALPADWQTVLKLTIKHGQGQTTTWTVARNSAADRYGIQSSDRPWALQLQTLTAQNLGDAARIDKLLGTAPAPIAAAAAEKASAAGKKK